MILLDALFFYFCFLYKWWFNNTTTFFFFQCLYNSTNTVTSGTIKCLIPHLCGPNPRLPYYENKEYANQDTRLLSGIQFFRWQESHIYIYFFPNNFSFLIIYQLYDQNLKAFSPAVMLRIRVGLKNIQAQGWVGPSIDNIVFVGNWCIAYTFKTFFKYALLLYFYSCTPL